MGTEETPDIDSTLDRCVQAPGMSTLARASPWSILGIHVDLTFVLIKLVAFELWGCRRLLYHHASW